MSRYFTAAPVVVGANYVKVVEDGPPYCLQQKCIPKNFVLDNI